MALALAPDGRDLLGQPGVLAARAVAAGVRRVLIGVASIQGLEITGQLLVGLLNKLGQRRLGEVAILVIHGLDARAVDGQELAAEQVELAAE